MTRSPSSGSVPEPAIYTRAGTQGTTTLTLGHRRTTGGPAWTTALTHGPHACWKDRLRAPPGF